jgi:hypothetical protein
MTIRKIKFAWKYRRALWKYRKVIAHRREIGAAVLISSAVVAVAMLTKTYTSRNGETSAGCAG